MTIWRPSISQWIPKAVNTHIVYTYCFSTGSNVSRTPLNVTFIRTLSVLLIIFVDTGFVHRIHNLRAYTQTYQVVTPSTGQFPSALLRFRTYVFHAIPHRTFSCGSKAPNTATLYLQFRPLTVRPVACSIY